MSVPLTELGRRVLGHLPVWAEDEAAHVEAEGGPEVSVRSYTLPQFTARLAEDPSVATLTEAQCEESLRALAHVGLAEETGDAWRMTQAGLEALVAPADAVDQVPGAVVVGLHPAQADAIALGP